MGTQQIANLAWSFATLEFRDKPFLDGIAAAALNLGRQLHGQPKAMATLVWSLVQLHKPDFGWKLLSSTGTGINPDALGALLMECEQRGMVEHEKELLRSLARDVFK